MKWHKLSINPEVLEKLYEDVPELENVELFSIELNREGETFTARFNLPRFPDNPSSRWHKEFNTVQIQLIFWAIANFEARGWDSNVKVNVKIIKIDELFSVKLFNNEMNLAFSFSCEFFRIEKISAFQAIY